MLKHPFDEAIALAADERGGYTGQSHPAYGNMVGPFGGVIGATLLNAVMSHPSRLGDPVALTVHYASPIVDAGFTVHARAIRTNRSTQHWFIELSQGEQVAAFATAVTATRRETWQETAARFPQVPPPEQIVRAPVEPRWSWTGRYDMRFIEGGLVMSDANGDSAQTQLWICDHPPRALDFLSLSAICDAFFPRILIRRPEWTPASTVSLTTYFHADAAQLSGHGSAAVLGVACAPHFGKGFFEQSAEIWSAAGVLLATSHQIVYFKS